MNQTINCIIPETYKLVPRNYGDGLMITIAGLFILILVLLLILTYKLNIK
jgi:ABC-type multidrug transport system permease subunit